MEISFDYLSEKGKVRSHNEDSLGFDESTLNGKVYVVCDGMGGHVGGATASNLAVNSILEYFKKEKYDNIFNAIDRAMQFANEQIYVHTLAEPSLKGMGTTAVVLVIKNDDCYIGHVGDSRIYLKTDNKLHRITKDHSFVQTLVDAGVITDDQAESHPQKNQILKALGHGSEVKASVCSSAIKVQKGDVFMLCSDGLNGMIHDSLIEEMIDPANLEVSKLNLYNAAMENGGLDNISLLLVKVLSSSHYKKSVFESFNPGKPRVSNNFEEKHDETNLFPENTANRKSKPKKDKKLPMIIAGISILVFCSVLFLLRERIFGPNIPAPTGKENTYTMSDLKGMSKDQIIEIEKSKAKVTLNGETELTTKDGKQIILVMNTDGNTISEITDKKDIATKGDDEKQSDDNTVTKPNGDGETKEDTKIPGKTNKPIKLNLPDIIGQPKNGYYTAESNKDPVHPEKLNQFVIRINKIINDADSTKSAKEITSRQVIDWNPGIKFLDSKNKELPKDKYKDDNIIKFLPPAEVVKFKIIQ